MDRALVQHKQRLSSKPWFWAVLYFAQIIGFTFAYQYFSDDFYHSTAKNEPSLKEDEIKIANIISSKVSNHHNPKLTFATTMIYETQNSTALNLSDRSGDSALSGHLEVENIPSGETRILVDLFPNVPPLSEKHVVGMRFYMDKDQEFNELYQGWLGAHNGKLSRKTDLFWRSLYLSVVTTTTLGYGDIVPVTTKTRFLITVQTLLGVIFSAGFLSALFNRRRTD